jgi:hypothetical protein
VSRRITVSVRGLPCDVVYRERGGWGIGWYFASINWRMADCERLSALTRGEILAIDAACLADLVERRQDWNRRLQRRRERAA